MCLVIDANAADEFLAPQSECARGVLNWLEIGGGRVALSAKVTEELTRLSKFKGLLLQLERAGRVRRIKTEEIARAEQQLSRMTLRSNDVHIVALVLAGRVRTVFTRDLKLQEDLKNHKVIPKPRVRILTAADHINHLLRRDTCP